jgi:hypothetical protein
MTIKRFSKGTLRAELQFRVDSIQEQCGFDPSNGSAQIEAIASVRGNLLETAIFYGQFIIVKDLSWEYGLDVRLVPEGYGPERFFYKRASYTRYVRKA